MKLQLFVLLAGAFIYYCDAQSNHKFWGYVNVNDTNVYNQHIRKESSLLTVVETDVVYPPKVNFLNCFTLFLLIFVIFLRVLSIIAQ